MNPKVATSDPLEEDWVGEDELEVALDDASELEDPGTKCYRIKKTL